MSFENDTEVSISTTEWLVVPQTEVGNSRTKLYLGEKDYELNLHLLFPTGYRGRVHWVHFLSLSGPLNSSYTPRVLVLLGSLNDML